MSHTAEDNLADLIAREQRGFRRLLFAGLATLLVMGLMSAAMGVYLYAASKNLAETTRTLQRNAFESRRRMDAQNNRIVEQENAIRRIFDEIRGASGGQAVMLSAAARGVGLDAARAYLLRGRLPNLGEERLIRVLAVDAGEGAGRAALYAGVVALLDFDARGDQIADDAPALPASLQDALARFETASADPEIATLAHAGAASVYFRDAQSGRQNYSAEACGRVFEAVEASVPDGVPSPQPLYWRAQCERKLGMTAQSLADYARALGDSARVRAGGAQDAAETTLALNAFHGVGTTLIAAYGMDLSDPAIAAALATARETCGTRAEPAASEQMTLALSCLDQAIALRRSLRQTDNQLSGSGENMGFAYLRDGDYNAAYRNAIDVERTGLFAWNELVRALAAPQANILPAHRRRTDAAEARRNVSFFSVGQFNLCELQALFNPADYEAAVELLKETHPQEADSIGCARAV